MGRREHTSAIVWCAKNGHQSSIVPELVPILHNLMCSTNEIHVVLLQESRHNVRSEGERDTSVVLAPASNILVGIRPEEIAE